MAGAGFLDAAGDAARPGGDEASAPLSPAVQAGLAASGVVGTVWRVALDPRLRLTIADVERMDVRRIKQALAVLAALDELDLRRAARASSDAAIRAALQSMQGR